MPMPPQTLFAVTTSVMVTSRQPLMAMPTPQVASVLVTSVRVTPSTRLTSTPLRRCVPAVAPCTVTSEMVRSVISGTPPWAWIA